LHLELGRKLDSFATYLGRKWWPNPPPEPVPEVGYNTDCDLNSSRFWLSVL
jgi:hypothetical protein